MRVQLWPKILKFDPIEFRIKTLLKSSNLTLIPINNYYIKKQKHKTYTLHFFFKIFKLFKYFGMQLKNKKKSHFPCSLVAVALWLKRFVFHHQLVVTALGNWKQIIINYFLKNIKIKKVIGPDFYKIKIFLF